MLGFIAAVRISSRTTAAWEGRCRSVKGSLAGLRCTPWGNCLSLSIMVHLFVRGLVPDTHSKVYGFILRLPIQKRKSCCLLTFFISQDHSGCHFPINGDPETYDHVHLKAYNLHSSHNVGKYLGHEGAGRCSSKAAVQGKVSLEPRGTKASRAEALGQRTCHTLLKQKEHSRSGDGNQEQLMALTACGGGTASQQQVSMSQGWTQAVGRGCEPGLSPNAAPEPRGGPSEASPGSFSHSSFPAAGHKVTATLCQRWSEVPTAKVLEWVQ